MQMPRFFMHYLIAVISLVLFTGCAQVPLNKITTSGKPERLFTSKNLSDVRIKVIEQCSIRGPVEEKGSIICSTVLSGLQAQLAGVVVGGNQGSTTPEQKVSFLITQRGSDVFVMATSIWLESTTAFGQIRRVEQTDNVYHNNVQSFLDSL
jgi:hypothetical protein